MDTATKIVLDFASRSVVVNLRRPLTIGEIWSHFVARNHRPTIVTMAHGIARVMF